MLRLLLCRQMEEVCGKAHTRPYTCIQAATARRIFLMPMMWMLSRRTRQRHQHGVASPINSVWWLMVGGPSLGPLPRPCVSNLSPRLSYASPARPSSSSSPAVSSRLSSLPSRSCCTAVDDYLASAIRQTRRTLYATCVACPRPRAWPRATRLPTKQDQDLTTKIVLNSLSLKSTW